MLGELLLLHSVQLLYSKNNMVSDMNAMFLLTPDGTLHLVTSIATELKTSYAVSIFLILKLLGTSSHDCIFLHC